MMETTNIMSQFLLEDIINFLKTLVWYFVTVKMYDTPIYMYICVYNTVIKLHVVKIACK